MKLRYSFFENLVLVLIIVFSAFFLFSALPADPIRAMVGVNASEEAVQSLREKFGLDRTLWEQFGTYLVNLTTLNLGTSFVTGRPASSDVFSSFLSSLTYAGFALLIALLYSVLAAYISFMSNIKIKTALVWIHILLLTIPELLIAIAAGIFFLKFNTFGFIEELRSRQIVTASIVLAIYPSAVLAQTLINQFNEAREKPYVITSTGFGFKKNQLFGIIFTNSYMPWLALLSNIAAILIAGSIVVELVFSLPGLGRLIYQSILRSDYPMLQGIVLVTSISYVIFNLFIETIYNSLLISNKT